MAFTNGHALLVGIGTYGSAPDMSVPITADDAQAVAATMCDPRYCGYPQAQVTCLTNAGATRTRILEALSDLAARTTQDDTVLIFFSGHGVYGTDGAYQLTTHDTQFEQQRVVAGTGIGQGELYDRLRAIPAGRLILLINACHAGELSPVLGAGDAPFTGKPLPQQTADALLSTGSGRMIVTACREHQVAYIGAGPVTIFAQALTDGLQGHGLSSRAGYISAFDLYSHLYAAVGAAVERSVSPLLTQRYGGAQEPELTLLKHVGPFAVALYRGATTLGDFPGDHLPFTSPALHRRTEAESERAARQIIHAAQTIGIGGSVANSPITGGSHNTVSHSTNESITIDGPITGSGIAVGHGAQAFVTEIGRQSLAPLFAPVYDAIALRRDDPNLEKAEVISTVRYIEQEAQKGEQANEHRLTRWMNNLAAMAEDIFEVTVAALLGPEATFAAVARKVARRAKQERTPE